MNKTSEYRRRRGSGTGIGAEKSSVYMDIEAVVGGDLLTVASVIPEQYSLKKLWADIRDLCFDQPIKHATEVRFQVMLPWETSYATLKTETDLQDAFNKLREKKYSWAIFIIKTELDELEKDKGDSSLPKDRNEEDESPDAQFKVLLPPEPDVEWVDFDKDKEFALPDLNDESNTVNFAAATLIVQDSYESMAAVGLDDNTHDEELEAEKNIDDMDAGSEENLNQFEVDKREESSGSVHCDDGSASKATFVGNISSTQSSVVGPGKVAANITVDSNELDSFVSKEQNHAIAAQQRPPSSSVRTERAVYGRDDDKAKILDMVLSDDPSDSMFRVIPIVGMAGIGKTTLAREVYNDKAVSDIKFDIKAWVCVSDEFDVLSISMALLESITCKPCDLKALNEVQVQLQKALDGKKFLLVLDDVWNENYSLWEDLKAPFLAAAPNSKIIVTTRHSHVASTMGSVEHYNLSLLSDDDCWFVFMNHAFDTRDHIHVQRISGLFHKKVVQKCRGLPLAAKTLGGLLRTKHGDNAWEDILNSNIWDLPEQSGVLPVLKLSYHYLPSHLKRCFAYCAIFPKDYELKEKELVFLWMAEGIIQQPRNNKQLEDWGSECFHDLVSRSIFQQSSGDGSKFVMHDLVHDLAQLVSGESICRLEEANKLSRRFERVRHSSYTRGHFDSKIRFESLYEVPHLRTFLPVFIRGGTDTSYITNVLLSDMLPKFKKLRVLSLEGYYVTQLPNSIKELKLLRYLNVAGTQIRSLPESTSSLMHLRVLILRDCSRLTGLPSKMWNLINLRHLDIEGANSLEGMPYGMEKLKHLQTLSNFIVGKDTGSGLKDLKNLKFLHGELCISGLQNVNDLREAGEAMLCEKQNLQALSLQWGSQFDSSREEVAKEHTVLDMLQPHTNLKKLAITSYSGENFPMWIGDLSFSKMEVLELQNCQNCTSLPSLSTLGSLKQLSIKGMTRLKSIGSEFYGEDILNTFKTLETLRFENLPEWECWDTKENGLLAGFSSLRELSILKCPKFSGKLPELLPSLEILVISKCADLWLCVLYAASFAVV
ncbi:hypothetical protein WN944_015575 [Citrus x changshan-huyou]|uniref:NB-ARC domain-containing protein n=1 Tax=Citrus x changshan-huyou TaxID=2935761 RepID=A0AAP0M7T5_9ROSI